MGLNYCVFPRKQNLTMQTSRDLKEFFKFYFAHQPPLPETKLYIKLDWETDRYEIPIELQAQTSEFNLNLKNYTHPKNCVLI